MHIANVFFAYALLQAKRIKQRLLNPETALRRITRDLQAIPKSSLFSTDQIFRLLRVCYA